jgi:hypothetical protein
MCSMNKIIVNRLTVKTKYPEHISAFNPIHPQLKNANKLLQVY